MAHFGPTRLGAAGDPLHRIYFRLWQITVSGLTIGVTCWSYTLHPAIGLAATFLGKHVLVAVLAAGLDLPERPASR